MKALLYGLGLAAAMLAGTAASQPAAAFPAGLDSCQVAACGGKNGLVELAGSRSHWRHHGGWHGRWGHRWHGGHGWRGGIGIGFGFGFYSPSYYGPRYYGSRYYAPRYYAPAYSGYGYPYGVYGYGPYRYGYGYGDGYSIWSEVGPSVDVGYGYGARAGGDYIRYCSQRYRSFNPDTGLYRTYSGRYKRCAYPG